MRSKHQHAKAVLFTEAVANADSLESLKPELAGVPLVESKRAASLIKSSNIGILGVFEKYESELSAEEPHIVLDRPDNMGNLGTIIRSMAGFNYSNLAIVGEQSIDFWHPKVVRSTMGAIFHVKIQHFPDIASYQKQFKEHRLHPFMLEQNSRRLTSHRFAEKHSLIFGNESLGLASEYAKLGEPVFIEQSDKIDSLNLSVAASLAMHHIFTNTP